MNSLRPDRVAGMDGSVCDEGIRAGRGGAGISGATRSNIWRRRVPTLVLDSLVYGHREFVRWSDDFILADLADREALRLVFARYRISAVMHFAAFTYVGESVTDPAKYYRNNVIGTMNLLDAMREAGVGRIVFSSTCATYGEPQEIPLTEEHPQIDHPTGCQADDRTGLCRLPARLWA